MYMYNKTTSPAQSHLGRVHRYSSLLCSWSRKPSWWHVAGSVKSVVNYIIVLQEDKTKVWNVKVIPNEECVPKHKLLVMDMWFNATIRGHKKFEPRVHVWKLKEEKTCEE